jgi:hypothetical protein
MSRHALILYQVEDYQGRAWDVREERDTLHGWPLLLGWPEDTPRGLGGGGPRVIITHELAGYLKDLRFDPGLIELPLGLTATKRLRRELGYHRYRDRPLWWAARNEDLRTMTLEAFAAKHRCSTGAASQARAHIK